MQWRHGPSELRALRISPDDSGMLRMDDTASVVSCAHLTTEPVRSMPFTSVNASGGSSPGSCPRATIDNGLRREDVHHDLRRLTRTNGLLHDRVDERRDVHGVGQLGLPAGMGGEWPARGPRHRIRNIGLADQRTSRQQKHANTSGRARLSATTEEHCLAPSPHAHGEV